MIRVGLERIPATCASCERRVSTAVLHVTPATSIHVSVSLCSACAGELGDQLREAARKPAAPRAGTVAQLFARDEPDEDLRPLLRASIARAKEER